MQFVKKDFLSMFQMFNNFLTYNIISTVLKNSQKNYSYVKQQKTTNQRIKC